MADFGVAMYWLLMAGIFYAWFMWIFRMSLRHDARMEMYRLAKEKLDEAEAGIGVLDHIDVYALIEEARTFRRKGTEIPV